MPLRHALVSVIAVALLALGSPAAALAWGDKGHRLANRVAAESLPDDVPEFFRAARERLTDLSVEPDRWRVGELGALNRGCAPDHYLDLEFVRTLVDPARPPPHRYAFLKLLDSGGVLERHGVGFENVGYAPYRIAELTERLEHHFTRYALLGDPGSTTPEKDAEERRRGVEESIIWTAGVLGHYVADMANPHHATRHYNGWAGPNPRGFATDRGTHRRFESAFVNRVVTLDEVRKLVPEEPTERTSYLVDAWQHAFASNFLVEALYELDMAGAFNEGQEATEAGRQGARFAHERLAAGAALLRDLWTAAARRGAYRASRERVAADLRKVLYAEGFGRLRLSASIDGSMTLSGRVDSQDERTRAIELMAAGEGVTRVHARRLIVLH